MVIFTGAFFLFFSPHVTIMYVHFYDYASCPSMTLRDGFALFFPWMILKGVSGRGTPESVPECNWVLVKHTETVIAVWQQKKGKDKGNDVLI